MNITNFFDIFQTQAFNLFGFFPPSKDDPDFEKKNKEYEEKKNTLLEYLEVKTFNDQVCLRFSPCSVIFDLIQTAIDLKIMPTPESPKLLKLLDKQLTDFALLSDLEKEVEIPDSWIPYIDKIMTDDKLFCQCILHGEVNSKEPNKKSIPLKSRVINSMPKIRDALLAILPE